MNYYFLRFFFLEWAFNLGKWILNNKFQGINWNFNIIRHINRQLKRKILSDSWTRGHLGPFIFKRLFLSFSLSINSHELHHCHREFSADLMSIEKGDLYLWFLRKGAKFKYNPVSLIFFYKWFIGAIKVIFALKQKNYNQIYVFKSVKGDNKPRQIVVFGR